MLSSRGPAAGPDYECIIIGVGHSQGGDDAAGILALAELRKRPLPASVQTADIGTDGFALIQHLERARRAVIMDAVQMKRPAGTIDSFTPEEIINMSPSRPLSVHSFDLAQMLRLAARLGVKPEISLLGIQPQAMEPGGHLSPPVRAAIPKLAEAALTRALGKTLHRTA